MQAPQHPTSYQEDNDASAMASQVGSSAAEPVGRSQAQMQLSKKITHRSQSSPSSLITQKFGLRPTPSPPRLIIDHQTGDIIESYPSSYGSQLPYRAVNVADVAAVQTQSSVCADYNISHTNNKQPSSALVDEELLLTTNSSNNNYSNNIVQQQSHEPITIDYQTLLDSLQPQAQQLTTAQLQQQLQLQQQYSSYDPSALDHHFVVDNDGNLLQQYASNDLSRSPSPPSNHNNIINSNSNYNNNNNNYQDSNNQYDTTTNVNDDERRGKRRSERRAYLNSSYYSKNSNNSISDRLHPLLTKEQQSQLSETDNTIAIVTSPSPSPSDNRLDHHQQQQKHNFMSNNSNNDGYSDDDRTTIVTTPNKIHAKMARSATTSMMRRHQLNSLGRFGPAAQHHQLHLTPEQRLQRARQRSPSPNIEDFKLYDIWYNLRILLILLVSILAIYLVFTYLIEDCILYRPTHSYISVFISSLNIICILMFTLFWYCTSVTRTLYSNLSSSAFIISIYSILTVVNLSIAIVLFLINSCHFQKLVNTQSASALVQLGPLQSLDTSQQQQQATDSLAINEPFSPTELDQNGSNEPLSLKLERNKNDLSNIGTLERLNFMAKYIHTDDIKRNYQRRSSDQHYYLSRRHLDDGVSSTLLITSDNDIDPNGQMPARPPLISPWEAAWNCIMDNLNDFKRAFYRFLMKYDLKFIGALHAINSMCLQYCAMRVAVIRSHFCSPMPVYI